MLARTTAALTHAALVFLCYGGLVSLSAQAHQHSGLKAALDARIAPVQGEADIEVGVAIADLEGNYLYEHQADRMLVLASNTKILTTAAALIALPPDFRWKTEAYLDGQVLWIRGNGDPSLRALPEGNPAEQFLDALAEALRREKVSRLEHVWLDTRAFDREGRPQFWPSDQWQNYYCAPVASLVLEGGCLQVQQSPGRKTWTYPALAQPTLDIQARQTRTGDSFRAWWGSADQTLIVRGDLQRTASLNLAVGDPVEIFGRWVAHGLTRRGFRCGPVQEVEEGPAKPPGKLMHRQESAWTMAEAVTVANKYSDNFVAEMILKTLAHENGEQGSFASGVARVRDILDQIGLEGGRFQLYDGSGLSRNKEWTVNRSSPRDLCEVLSHMVGVPQGRIFFDSLPIGGVEGRLKRRFRDPIFHPQRMHGKTGWIRGASSLSGYLLTMDDRILVFSIVINYTSDGTPRTNNARFKKLQEEILADLLRQWPPS